MPNLLQELQNNEAVLLMYVAGELAEEDRAEVEQMLAADASFRAELEEVRSAMTSSDAALASLDTLSRLPVKQDAALRQVNRLMSRWNVERLARVPTPVQAKGLRFPWWSYPLATAASVLLAFLVYWGNREDAPVLGPTGVENNVAFAPDSQGPPVVPNGETEAFDEADRLVQSFDNTDPILGNAASTILLADADDQFDALASATEDVLSLNVVESLQ